jgi:hypothetical protein
MSRYHRPSPTTPTPEAHLCGLLAPHLTQLAGDAWVLAQRSPALVADPALLGAAERLRALQCRLFRHDAARRLLPDRFAPGLTLHALALGLRQMQAALAPLLARLAPPREPDASDVIDDIAHLEALILRGFGLDLAERTGVALPPGLRPVPPPPPPPEPGRPPGRNPFVHRVRHQNSGRRMRRIVEKPENPEPAEKLIPPRIRSL